MLLHGLNRYLERENKSKYNKGAVSRLYVEVEER
jgi:hypothetical protein